MAKKNAVVGLKLMRSGSKKEDRRQCDNCRCVRYGKCGCARKGDKPPSAVHLPHPGTIRAPQDIKREEG